MFKWKTWLLGPVRFDPARTTVVTSHDVGAINARDRGPGHVIQSSNTESKGLLPGARSPLEAGVPGVPSTAEEPRALHAVIVSGIREGDQ